MSESPANVEASLEKYFSSLTRLVSASLSANVAAHAQLEKLIGEDAEFVRQIVVARKSFMTDSDKEKAAPFLPIGFFRDAVAEDRLVLYTITFEAEEWIHSEQMTARLEPYSKKQPLFQMLPDLWEHVRVSGERDADLISVAELEFVDGTEFARFQGRYLQLDRGLNPGLLRWMRQQFRTSPLYVRLHPHRVFDELPRSLLQEAIIRPIDPNWWATLKVYPGNKDGLAHELLPPASPKEDLESWWEYHAKGIRRLEMSVGRRNSGNLSVMIEELTRPVGSHEEVLGLCVHMDTDSAVGTAALDARLNHLDLALNWYPGRNGETRLNQRLDDGMVQTATRSHLLRVEDIPFTALFEITSAFFTSRVLVREWLSAQSFTTPPATS